MFPGSTLDPDNELPSLKPERDLDSKFEKATPRCIAGGEVAMKKDFDR
jgi:hypothetical protein